MEEDVTFRSPWMDSVQAGKYLGVKPKTLAVWRCQGRGPKSHPVCGRLVRYHRDDLDAFVIGGDDAEA